MYNTSIATIGVVPGFSVWIYEIPTFDWSWDGLSYWPMTLKSLLEEHHQLQIYIFMIHDVLTLLKLTLQRIDVG